MKNKKIKKISYIPWRGTPKNDVVFDANEASWEYELKKQLKSLDIEIHTNDILPIKDADACLIFDNIFYKNIDYFIEMYNQKKLHKAVYIDYEPPTGHCKNHSKQGIKRLSKIFKYLITYDDDLVDGKRILKGNIGNFYSKELEYKKDFNDRKLITMITHGTNNEQIIGMLNYYNATSYYNEINTRKHKKELYTKRNSIASYLLEYHAEDFDLYGTLWPEKFKPVKKGELDRNEKLMAMSKYKFAVCFDSYKNQNGYISEKIFDAFNAKVIPIYLGASNVEKYIPKNCFIDFRDFANYKELMYFLEAMTEEEYEEYIASIEKYLTSDKYLKHFSSEASAKILCEALLRKQEDFSYAEAKENIDYFIKKREKVHKKRGISFYTTRYDNNGESISIIFTTKYYRKNEKGRYVVKANGIEVPKKEIKNERNIENYLDTEFECDFDDIDRFLSVKVYYLTENENVELFLSDLNPKFSKKIGLYLSYSKKKIYYPNIIKMSLFQKSIFLIFKDPKKFIHFFKEKIKCVVYRIRKFSMVKKRQ